MKKMEYICIFLFLGTFLFGCGSQIRTQAQSLSISVPATMTVDQRIQATSVKTNKEALPVWLEQCLATTEYNPQLFAAEYPSVDLARMEMVKNHFHFHSYLSGAMKFLRFKRVARIVGRIKIRNPNTATLEAMYEITRKYEAARLKENKSNMPGLVWTWQKGAWQSNYVTLLRYEDESGRRNLLYSPYSSRDQKATNMILDEPDVLPLLNEGYRYNIRESGVERLVRQIIAPEYQGVASFRPDYVELIVQDTISYTKKADEQAYTNVCFPVNPN